jgi:uncharacterized paraquat-inducible protein A
MKQKITKCSRCGATLKVETTDVLNKTTGEQSVLYQAHCRRCRRTIYTDTIEEMTRPWGRDSIRNG